MSAPLWKDEKLLSEYCFDNPLPLLLIIIGGLETLIGLILMVEIESPIFLFGILVIIVGAFLWRYREVRLVITTKRVFVDGPFNRFTSMSLQHITTVSATDNTLHISAAGGGIHLSGAFDAKQACHTITALMNGMQENMDMSNATADNGEGAEKDYWICDCGEKNGAKVASCRYCGASRGGNAHRSGVPSLEYKQCKCGANVPVGICPLCGEKVD